eukprot:1666744-Pyramimonas_sp.AAC.1
MLRRRSQLQTHEFTLSPRSRGRALIFSRTAPLECPGAICARTVACCVRVGGAGGDGNENRR